MCFYYYFLCVPVFCFDFCVCVFCIVFLGCVFFFCFSLIFFFLNFILNFNRNRQNNMTMKFQDASCPPLAVSVLSSPVEPPSQSLAVSVSSSLDVTVMVRRSTWSSMAMSVALNCSQHLSRAGNTMPRVLAKWTQMHLPSAFVRLSSLTAGLTWLLFPLA